MEYQQRKYPMFSACGLNCGLCPRYQMDGSSKCPGCSGKDFLSKHPKCGVLSCCHRKGYEYCFECGDFPCPKYDGADQKDSFITHLRQFRDMDKAKALGIDAYKKELDEKTATLENLLTNYNDGRRKSFFCLAVNLLELQDVRRVMEQIAGETKRDYTAKDKADMAVRLFKNMAAQRHISLKLRIQKEKIT